MIIMEIMKDALNYPLKNIKALVLYLVLGIIFGIILSVTVAAMIAGMESNNFLEIVGVGIIGGLISLFLAFVIAGYELDIVKYGIERNAGAPVIDVVRQSLNGIKLIVVELVYFLIPLIISGILAIIFQHWLSTIIMVILFIIFGMAAFMAQCRLAKTEDMIDALAIGEAIGDIARVGIVNLIVFAILVVVVTFILFFITGLISNYAPIIGGILSGIVGIYISLVVSRASGLLYSTV